MKLPTQNNLTEVIKTTIKQLGLLATAVEEADKELVEADKGIEENTERVLKVIKGIIDINRIVINAEIDDKVFKAKMVAIKGVIDVMTDGISEFADSMDKAKPELQRLSERLTEIQPLIKNIDEVLTDIVELISGAKFKINVMKSMLKWVALITVMPVFVMSILAICAAFAVLEKFNDQIEQAKKTAKTIIELLDLVSFIFRLVTDMKVGVTTILILTLLTVCVAYLSVIILALATTIAGAYALLDAVGAGEVVMALAQEIEVMAQMTKEVLDIVDQIKVGAKTAKKIADMTGIFDPLKDFVKKVQEFFGQLKDGDLKSISEEVEQLKTAVGGIGAIMASLLAIVPLGLLYLMAFPVIIMILIAFGITFKLIKFIVSGRRHSIAPVPGAMAAGNSKKAIIKMALIVGALILLLIALIALGVQVKTVLNYAMQIILFLGVLLLIAVGIKLFTMVANRLLGLKVLFILGLLLVITTLLVVLALELWVLGVIAGKVNKYILDVLLFLGVMVLIMLAFALIGFVAQFILPWVIIGAIALVIIVLAVTVIVGCVLLIAVMLWLIAEIKLDPDKIMENVDIIFNTVWDILERLYTGEKPKDSNEGKGFMGFIKAIFGRFGDIIVLLLGCIMLVLTVIAVGCILLIAAMLYLIEHIKLNPDKILENVDLVFDIADKIIQRVMAPRDEKGKKSERGPLIGIIAWVMGEGVAKVIEALITLAYVFLVFITIFIVLLIASMLWLISKINLDPDKVMNNVNIVFDAADRIIQRVMAPRDEGDGKKSERGFFISVIAWVLGDGVAKIIEALLTIVYVFLIFIAVAIVLGIAKILKEVQDIDLKADKILENVDICFDTADYIISRVFTPREDDSEKSNKGALITVIEWIFGSAVAKIIETLIAIVYVFLIMICITIVLGIAKLLEEIQNIDLDVDKVQENVKCVFDTADMIINRVMAPRDEDGQKSERGILLDIVGWVLGEGMVKIIEACIGIVYVFLMMICITIVLGIAKLLKEIQDLDLDYEKIKGHVKCVFDVADMIVERVFEKKDKKGKQGGSFLGTIIGFFNPDLGKIIDAIMMIIHLALIFMAITIVKAIAEAIADICKIPDLNDAKDAVDRVFSISQYIIDKVFNSPINMPEAKGEEEWWWMFVPLPNSVLMYMKRMRALNTINTALGLIKQIALSIKDMWESVKDINLEAARDMVEKIISIAEVIAQKIFGEKVSFSFLEPTQEDIDVAKGLVSSWDMFWSGQKKVADTAQQIAIQRAMLKVQALTAVAGALGALKDIASAIEEITKIDISGIGEAQTKIVQLLDFAQAISNQIFGAEVKVKLPELTADQKSIIRAAAISRNTSVEKAGAIASFFGASDKVSVDWGRVGEDQARMEAEAQMAEATARVQAISMTAASVSALIEIANAAQILNDTELPNLSTDASNPILKKVDDILKFAGVLAQRIFAIDFGDLFGAREVSSKSMLGVVQYHESTADQLKNMNEIAGGLTGILMVCYQTIGSAMNVFVQLARQTEELNKLKISDAEILVKVDSVIGIAQKFEKWNNVNLGEWKMKNMKENLALAMDTVVNVNGKFKKLGKTSFSEDTATRINAMVATLTDNVEKVGGMSVDYFDVERKLSLMDHLNETLNNVKVSDKDVVNHKKMTDNFVVFLNKLDRMNFSSLSLGESMMRHFTMLAARINGDFNGLATAINENMAPLIEDLKKTLTEVNKCQREILEELSQPIDLNVPNAGSFGGPAPMGPMSSDTGSTSDSSGGTLSPFSTSNSGEDTNSQNKEPGFFDSLMGRTKTSEPAPVVKVEKGLLGTNTTYDYSQSQGKAIPKASPQLSSGTKISSGETYDLTVQVIKAKKR